MAIGLTGNIVPFGAFFILEDIYLKGGFQAVADNTARDAILAGNRKAGMLVWSEGAGTLYQLGPGLTNGDWVVFGVGAISSATPGNDVSATTANNGAGNAGDVALDPGDSTAGNGGSVVAAGGDGSVDGGDINLSGGTGTAGDGGDINLTPGSGGTNQGVVNVLPPAGGTAPELRLFEDAASGTDYVALKAPAALAASWTFTFPVDDGTPGQVLQTDGAGNTSWVNPGGGGGSSFRASFTDASLAGGVLSVNHARGERYCQFSVFDNNGALIHPDSVITVDANNANINFTSFQTANGGAIPGTWNVVVTP